MYVVTVQVPSLPTVRPKLQCVHNCCSESLCSSKSIRSTAQHGAAHRRRTHPLPFRHHHFLPTLHVHSTSHLRYMCIHMCIHMLHVHSTSHLRYMCRTHPLPFRHHHFPPTLHVHVHRASKHTNLAADYPFSIFGTHLIYILIFPSTYLRPKARLILQPTRKVFDGLTSSTVNAAGGHLKADHHVVGVGLCI